MSNIFISHSSLDKPFVKKLAAALLAKGFPIWLDSWRLEIGDSLLDTIYDAIDSSSLVLLVISRKSIESGWVNRELNAALTKEQQSGRKFLIPLKIDDCDSPLKVADRIYADFAQSFTGPLQQLSAFLEQRGCRNFKVPLDKELLALQFTAGVHLNQASFSEAGKHFVQRQGGQLLDHRQIVATNDPEHEELLRRLHVRIDNVASDRFFSPNLEAQLRHSLNEVQTYEEALRKGIALLVNNAGACAGFIDEVAYWYCRIVRGRILYPLYATQRPGDSDILDYGKAWACAELSSGTAAMELFEVPQVTPVDATLPASSKHLKGYFHFWLPRKELSKLLDDEDRYLGPGLLLDVCSHSAISKFILPQMLLAYMRGGHDPVPWSLEDVDIGIH